MFALVHSLGGDAHEAANAAAGALLATHQRVLGGIEDADEVARLQQKEAISGRRRRELTIIVASGQRTAKKSRPGRARSE